MNGLNISKLKKVSSDKNTTTFRHPDGHEIKVAHKALSPKLKKDLENIPHYAEGTGDVAPAEDMSALQGLDQVIADQNPQMAAPDQVAPQPQTEMAPVQSAPSAPVAEANPEPQQAAPAAAPAQEAPQDVAQQAAPPVAQNFAEHKKAALDEHLAENKAFEQDMTNGHITPKTYGDLFASKSTLGKIGTAFGLLLGGMGSGLTHQPNALLAMMDKQIGNDLEAQKVSKGNALDFLKLNQQRLMNQAQVKNLNAETNAKAYALSRAQMNSAALHQMVQMAQKFPEGSPQRAQADQALAFMNNAVQAENYSIADRYATGSAFAKMLYNNQPGTSDEQNFQKQTSGMRMLGPQGEKRAEDIESKHVPGFKGQASVPVSKADRDALMGHQKLQSGLDDLLNFTKTHSTIIPGTKEYNIGQSKVRKLQSEIREGVLGTVYKAGEQPLLDKFVAQNPAGLDKWWKTIPQLQTLKDANTRDLNVRKSSLGFPVDKQADSAQAQPQIKVVNGVKYMRGPNGEAVKVP